MGVSYDMDNCVTTTLEKIVDVQNEVRNNHCNKCESFCVCEFNENDDIKNTVPVVLYCGCEPFKAEGITTFIPKDSKRKSFYAFSTFLFKVKDIINDCVVLELLLFEGPNNCVKDKKNCGCCSLTCQAHCREIDQLRLTGVCIKMEIKTFTGIQCLPAVNL